MCGRYYIKESAEMDEIIRLMNASPLKLALEKRELGVRTYGERFPSEVVPAEQFVGQALTEMVFEKA
ncbi:hypothetical protein SAMN04487771_10035 [[Clostridium] aminophilum]|uniref:Uncharacterized protein n=2 Tax=[Clostridium] aminophilum TaxID=1526 RepID=A0A1I0AWQ7_9FIRM|nr:hypothetical protein SAMN04487771_10035 [[Clostridium] aminophilum]